ncbi:hypothetical protein D3C87_122560 [compost metagenome]|nr:hypothetical protein [Janthinobacterium sp. Marseille]ABR91254.1 Hypothetical protein mma_2372 [Janthinobacterium sp. Marseille]
MSTHDESHDVHLQQLTAADRQVRRTRRAEAVRQRQRVALLNLMATSMAEFGISHAELIAARRAIGERAGNKAPESEMHDLHEDEPDD